MTNINFSKEEGETLRHDEWNALGAEFGRLENKIEDSKGTKINFPNDSKKFLNGEGDFSVPTLKPINVNSEVEIVQDDEDAKVTKSETENEITLSFSLPKGDKGDTGKVYVPSVDEESGNLSWSLQDNPQGIDSTNIKGPQGERGVGLDVNSSKLDKVTTINITTDTTTPETLETFQIIDGNDGHNPCLGRLNAIPDSFSTAFPNAIEGDYVYVDLYDSTTQTTTTTIYHYVSNGNTLEWDEGTVIDTENPTFATTQTVETVGIKDLDGNNDTNATGVLSADAGKELRNIVVKDKLIYTAPGTYNWKANVLTDGHGGYKYGFNSTRSCTFINLRKEEYGILPGDIITITPNGTYATAYGFVIDSPTVVNSYEINDPVQLLDGVKTTSVKKSIEIPNIVSDGLYLYIKGIGSTGDCKPLEVKIERPISIDTMIPEVIDDLATEDSDKALSANQGAVIANHLFLETSIEGYYHSTSYGTLGVDGKRYNRTTDARCRLYKFGRLFDNNKLHVKPSANGNANIAFIQNTNGWDTAAVDFAGTNNVITISTEQDIAIPAYTNWLYVKTKDTSGNSVIPDKLYSYAWIDDVTKKHENALSLIKAEEYKVDSIIGRLEKKDIPIISLDPSDFVGVKTLQEKIVRDRIDSFVDCRWTPKSGNIPWSTRSMNYINHYEANVEYQGLPYSSNSYHGKWLGTHVSKYTFLTAVNNPYSLLYTECVKTANSASAWGYVYETTNGSTYYGGVCCSFTGYATNAFVVFDNPAFFAASQRGYFDLIQPHEQEGHTFIKELLKIGDILDNAGHSFVVYDLKYNNEGKVIAWKVYEATSGVDTTNHIARGAQERTSQTMAYDIEHFDHYRYNGMALNLRFERFETDNIADEDIVYNNDICTIAGDKCTFSSADNVIALNYNLRNVTPFNYTTIAVQKGTDNPTRYLISNIDNDEYDSTQQNHAFKLEGLTSGEYEAWCEDDNENRSSSTKFIVVSPDDISYELKDDGILIRLINPSYKIAYLKIDKASPGYALLEDTPTLALESDILMVQPHEVFVNKARIPNYSPDKNYTIDVIDIYTKWGVQRMKNIPLYDENEP